MHTFSSIAKRLLVAASLVLVTACGSNGITEPSARKSGYLTVSAAVRTLVPVTTTTTTTTTTTSTAPSSTTIQSPLPGKGMTIQSGYNVPAN